jgi:hypothetical protein
LRKQQPATAQNYEPKPVESGGFPLMALTKETVVDKIEVLESNAIQVRSAIRVLEDGEVLSESYHRHVLQPGDDLSNEDTKVEAIANSVWPLILPT